MVDFFHWACSWLLACSTDIEKFLSEQDVNLSQESPNPGGGNYGDIEVLDKIVRFSSGNRWVRVCPIPNRSKHKALCASFVLSLLRSSG